VALTKLRRTTPATPVRNTAGPPPSPPPDVETLTFGALYDIALHGASVSNLALHGALQQRNRSLLAGASSLIASALTVRKDNAQDIRRLIQPWQARAMSYFDLVPEVNFAATYMGNMQRKVRLFPALMDDETHEPEEVDSGPIFDVFDRIRDRSGGREDLQADYARLKYLIGEGYLTASPDPEYGEVWEFLSPNELRVQPGGYASRFRAPMLSADQYLIGNDPAQVAEYGEPEGPSFAESGPDVILVYRLWRQHPAYSFLANCHMQACVDILEELVLSQYSVRAQLKSRLNQAGILWIPDEISFTGLGNDAEEDPTTDVFQQRIAQASMAAISDPGSAAALVPIIARIAGEYIKDITYTRFNDSTGELAEISQRTEMVERYAVGSELPPELFRSKEDINHWGSWMVDEDQWKAYGHPMALEFSRDLVAAYLRPTLKAMDFPDWERATIGIDPAAVINHPDRAKDADALYAGRAISKKVWRESKGYNDNDEMPRDEINESLGVAIHDGSLALFGIPSVRTNIEPTPGDIESAQGGSTAPVDPNATGADVERGAPQTGPPSEEDQAGPALQASAGNREAELLGAAMAGVHRGRSLAGAKLRSMTSPRGPRDARCEECQKAIDGVANWDVASALGEDTVRGLNANGSLVDGTAQECAAVFASMGVTSTWASELGELVEQHASRTLFQKQPESFPPGFAVLLRKVDTPLEQA